MGIGVLFAVVITSTPAAQAALTATEAHFRSLAAFQSTITQTSRILPNNPLLNGPVTRHVGLPPMVLTPRVRSAELTFQNPGMMSFVEVPPATHPSDFAIEADTYRQVIGGGSIPLRILALDLTKQTTFWSFVAALFVSTRPLSSLCDFDVRAIRSNGIVVSGRPLQPGSSWSRVEVEIDTATTEVRSMTIVATRGFEEELSFGAFVAVPSPGRASFVPKLP